VECAKSANRSKDTYLAAQYARLRARRGANKATIAVCHSILTAVWHMLRTGETFTDPGGDFYTRRDPERTRRRLVDQLESLGYTVTLQESAPAA
jgi:transposase